MDRSEKVAVARKKLKKFQSRSKTPNESNHITSDSPPFVKITVADEHNGLENGSLGDVEEHEDIRRLSDSPQVFASHQADLQSHAKTIDVLVGEKSELQMQVSKLQSQLKSKTKEATDLDANLQAVKRKLDEIQREKLSLSNTLAKREEALSHSSGHHSSLEQALQQMRSSLEDQRQENAELISKITAQSAQVRSLQTSNTDLQNRLGVAQLLVQQLSAGGAENSSPASHQERLQGGMETLRSSVYKLTSERDQALMDVAALRDALTSQQQSHATNLAALQGQLADGHAQTGILMEKLAVFEQERGLLAEHVAEVEERSKVRVYQVSRENDELEQKLQQHIQDNAQLARLHRQQEEATQELEAKLTRLQEQVVDQKDLLTTISQDKETISRAMAQNKELKNNLAELQEAFVKQSHQSMELASELETAKRRCAQLEGQLELGKQQKAQLEGQLGSERQHRAQLEGEMASERQHRAQLEGEMASERQHQAPLGYGQAQDLIEAERSHCAQLEQQLEAARFHEAQLEKRLMELVSSVGERQRHDDGIHDQSDGSESAGNAQALHKDLMRRELKQLQVQYEQLTEEHQVVLEKLHKYEQPSEDSGPVENTMNVDLHNMTSEQLDAFSSSYSALQQKFLALMAEKAELLEQLQAKDHIVMQLSGETETIGEYISLYQLQRQALKSKFMENDRFVQQVMAEKASVQAKLQELQGLVRKLLSERAANPPWSPSDQATTIEGRHVPDLNRSLPTHLRHQPIHSSTPKSNALPPSIGDPSDTPVVPPTALQIMNLIKELETHNGPATKDGILLCPCCTGEILVV